ncbi:MAG: hypothetical protein H6907_13275 [Hyphomicrobiales bacterium]|nr:hypothetical protein [Hyphomicrobiales bacterium]MCP5372697.1 hypothetical protein [Hyphomicrobiales bacterium]
MPADDYDDDGFEQRPNVRWENDFGPRTPMWQRYLMAAGAVVVVGLFLGFALFSGLGSPQRDAPDGGPSVWLFLVVIAAVVVIALGAEGWVLRLRRRFGRGDPE